MAEENIEYSSFEYEDVPAEFEKEQAEAIEKYSLEELPTTKHHVSFSELSDWSECTWRHMLKYIKKIDLDETTWALIFGTAIHSACEHYLKTREMDVSIAKDQLVEGWKVHDIKQDLDEFLTKAESILNDIPAFMDREFIDWEYIDAEHFLYEPVEGHKHAFKGFIDGIIKAKNKRGKTVYWLIDFKTCSWGWDRYKKSNDRIKSQIVYYKNFWSKKSGIDLKNIRCGFALLKRDAKPGQHCELFAISVGEVPIKRSLKVVDNMFVSMKRGTFVKNKTSCRWCVYKETEHCPGSALGGM